MFLLTLQRTQKNIKIWAGGDKHGAIIIRNVAWLGYVTYMDTETVGSNPLWTLMDFDHIKNKLHHPFWSDWNFDLILNSVYMTPILNRPAYNPITYGQCVTTPIDTTRLAGLV